MPRPGIELAVRLPTNVFVGGPPRNSEGSGRSSLPNQAASGGGFCNTEKTYDSLRHGILLTRDYWNLKGQLPIFFTRVCVIDNFEFGWMHILSPPRTQENVSLQICLQYYPVCHCN